MILQRAPQQKKAEVGFGGGVEEGWLCWPWDSILGIELLAETQVAPSTGLSQWTPHWLGFCFLETHLCSYLLRALCESRELRKRGALERGEATLYSRMLGDRRLAKVRVWGVYEGDADAG